MTEKLTGQVEPELHLSVQSVPRSKHTVSVTKTGQLMLYREIMAVCSEIHTNHINTAVWACRSKIDINFRPFISAFDCSGAVN